MTLLLDRMTRFLLRSRRVMAVGILLLLAGVFALSAATRRPCFQAHTGTWHLWKAGHMNKTEGRENWNLRAAVEAQRPNPAQVESPVLPPSIDQPSEETIPPALSLVEQVRHFRSPPALA